MPTEGTKHDQGKRRFSLFPTKTLLAIIDVLEFGARKYGEFNWIKVPNARQRYYDAAMRHIHAWWLGEANDAESGQPHLAHASACIIFLLTLDLEGQHAQDRQDE